MARLEQCLVCNAPMAPRKGKFFCRAACEQKAKRSSRRPAASARTFDCANCGTAVVVQGSTRRRYCSHACSVRAGDRRRRGLINDRRGTRIGLFELAERDGWTCGICRLPVDRAAPARSIRSASMDHIIPLARGGLHTEENLQLAHYGCNVRKRDRLVAA